MAYIMYINYTITKKLEKKLISCINYVPIMCDLRKWNFFNQRLFATYSKKITFTYILCALHSVGVTLLFL